MDLITANMKCRLNFLKVIKFAAKSWNSIGGYSFVVSGSRVRSSKSHRLQINVHK